MHRTPFQDTKRGHDLHSYVKFRCLFNPSVLTSTTWNIEKHHKFQIEAYLEENIPVPSLAQMYNNMKPTVPNWSNTSDCFPYGSFFNLKVGWGCHWDRKTDSAAKMCAQSQIINSMLVLAIMDGSCNNLLITYILWMLLAAKTDNIMYYTACILGKQWEWIIVLSIANVLFQLQKNPIRTLKKAFFIDAGNNLSNTTINLLLQL